MVSLYLYKLLADYELVSKPSAHPPPINQERRHTEQPHKDRVQPFISQRQPPESCLEPAEETLHTTSLPVRALVESRGPSPSPPSTTVTPVGRDGTPYPPPLEVPSYPPLIVRRVIHDLTRSRSGPPARPDPDAIQDVSEPPAVVLVARTYDEAQWQPFGAHDQRR